MQLLARDGSILKEIHLLITFTYHDGKITARSPKITDPEKLLPSVLTSCEDALMFQITNTFEYCDEAVCYALSKDDSYPIDGCYIAISYSNEYGKNTVITNARDSTILMGCCHILSHNSTSVPGQQAEIEKEVSFLRQLANKKTQRENGQRNFAYQMFVSGTAAVTCTSPKEYEAFIHAMLEDGFYVDKSVNPDGWDSFSRYISYHFTSGTLTASPVIPEGCDATLKAARIIS